MRQRDGTGRRWLGLAALLALAACTVHGPDRLTLTPVPFAALPGWTADRLGEAMPALLRSCASLARMPPDQPVGGEGEAARLGGTAGQWMPACTAARRLGPASDARVRALLERALQPFAVANNFAATPRFTGYYEPTLMGDLAPGPDFPVPLLGRPPDLVQRALAPVAPDPRPRRVFGRLVGGALRPYFDRGRIEDGVLDGRGLELLWLADPVDLFFLQIQGSGRVVLPDGRMLRVGYAAQNGQGFVDVGGFLARHGELDRDHRTMQDVRDWLRAHPAAGRAVMDQDPSYVFFRAVDGLRPEDGPLGALGVPLTPGRSAAVDPRFLPLGAPLWIDTVDSAGGSPLRRLMLAQDVGGAIRGPARADLFFGWGPEAEWHAGGMLGHGGEYVLLPRDVAPMARPEALRIAGR